MKQRSRPCKRGRPVPEPGVCLLCLGMIDCEGAICDLSPGQYRVQTKHTERTRCYGDALPITPSKQPDKCLPRAARSSPFWLLLPLFSSQEIQHAIEDRQDYHQHNETVRI